MAATASPGRPKDEDDNDDEVPCPICGYTNSPRSVEAHISAKTDEQHRGEVGRKYRDQLRTPPPETNSAPTTTGNEKGGELAQEGAEKRIRSDVARDNREGDGTSDTYSNTTELAEEHVTGEVAEPDESDTSLDAAHAGVPAIVFAALLLALVLVVLYLTWPRRSERERDDRSQHHARHPFV